MSDEQYRLLLDELVRAVDVSELRDVIERNLTKLGLLSGFDRYLSQRFDDMRKVDPDKASRLADIDILVKTLVECGNYRKAEFDESNPANSKEILLALARQVERDEFDLVAAVDQGVRDLSRYPESALRSDWVELSRSIQLAQDPAVHVMLAELMYQIARCCFPSLFPSGSLAVISARSAEAMKLREGHEPQAALQIYERLVTIAEENGELRLQVQCLMSMGDIHRAELGPPAFTDHLARAEQYFLQALHVCDQASLEPSLHADILFGLGQTVTGQGRFKEGIDRLQECLSLYRSVDSVQPQQVYDCLIALARACKDAADYRSASMYLQEATTQAPDVESQIWALVELADVLGFLGEAGTVEILSRACQLVETLEDRSSATELRRAVYGTLGSYQGRTGNLQDAIDAYHYAIKAAIECGDEKSEARWRSNLARIYAGLDQWKKANEEVERAAEVHQRLGDTLAIANLLSYYAMNRLAAGRLIEAARLAAHAYVLYYQECEPVRMGDAAYILGEVYREKKDLRRAQACIDYCHSIAEGSDSTRLKCLSLSTRAKLQVMQDKVAEAVETYNTVIDLAEHTGYRSVEQEIRVRRGKLLEKQTSTKEAEDDFRRAVELREAMRGRFRSTEQRVQFLSTTSDVYTPLVRLLSKQHDRPGAMHDAFSFAERARSRTFAELLSRTPVRQPVSLPQALASQEAQLLEQLLRLEESDEFGLETAQQYDRLNQELEGIWRQIAAIDEACRNYVDLRWISLVDREEIIKLLRG